MKIQFIMLKDLLKSIEIDTHAYINKTVILMQIPVLITIRASKKTNRINE